MAESIKGTQTEKHLLMAFAGESQASGRYAYFAGIAGKEGYREIQEAFEEASRHERAHAKTFFKYLEGGEVEITASFPAGRLGTTAENLKAAAEGEKHEHTHLYPSFAEAAKKEGFTKIAATFLAVARAEVYHEDMFLRLLAALEGDRLFEQVEPTKFICMNCGYVHEGKSAPKFCPACVHPVKHFKVLKG